MSKRTLETKSGEEPPQKKPRYETAEKPCFVIDHGPKRKQVEKDEITEEKMKKHNEKIENNQETKGEDKKMEDLVEENNENNNDIVEEKEKPKIESESETKIEFGSPNYSGSSTDTEEDEENNSSTKIKVEGEQRDIKKENTNKEQITKVQKSQKEQQTQVKQVQSSNTYSPYGTYVQKPKNKEEYASPTTKKSNLSIDSIDDLVNAKGKLLEYFQKTRQTPPQFEYCVRVSIGKKTLEDKIWYPSVKEAERKLSIIALTQLATAPQEIGLQSLHSVPGFTLEGTYGPPKGTVQAHPKKKDQQQQQQQQLPKQVKIKQVSEGIPFNTDFRDSLLNALVADSKKPLTVHPGSPKGDLKNWCLRAKVKCEVKSVVNPSTGKFHASVLLNHCFFYSNDTESTISKEAENNVCKSALSLLLLLKEFILSPHSFPILRLGQEFFLTQNNIANDHFFSIPYNPQSTSVDSIASILPFISRSLNCLINSKKGGTIHIGISDRQDNFMILGVQTQWLNDLRSQVTTMVSGWLPRPSPGAYKWKVIPVYEDQEISTGVHYRDLGKVYEKMCWYEENNMDWDISPIIQFGLQAIWCVVLLEVPYGRSTELYCSQEGAFSHDFEDGKNPLPIDRLSPSQQEYMKKQPAFKNSSSSHSSSSSYSQPNNYFPPNPTPQQHQTRGAPPPPPSSSSSYQDYSTAHYSQQQHPTGGVSMPYSNPQQPNPHMMYYAPAYSYYPPSDHRMMQHQQHQHPHQPISSNGPTPGAPPPSSRSGRGSNRGGNNYNSQSHRRGGRGGQRR